MRQPVQANGSAVEQQVPSARSWVRVRGAFDKNAGEVCVMVEDGMGERSKAERRRNGKERWGTGWWDCWGSEMQERERCEEGGGGSTDSSLKKWYTGYQSMAAHIPNLFFVL